MIIIKINSIYDLISLSILFFNFYSIGTFQFELIIVNTIALIAHKIIKKITIGIYPSIFKRPDGAINCDVFNCGGIASHKSGFPSGHMTSISFFMNSLLIKSNKELTINNIFLYNIPCILMGIARYEKKCHNVIQILFGYLFGLLFSYLLNKYYYKRELIITNLNTIENSNESKNENNDENNDDDNNDDNNDNNDENKKLLDKNNSNYKTMST